MPGLGVAETAQRLAELRAGLTESVLAAARRLPDEPRLEVKAAIASHLYDDARSVRKLDARLADLVAQPDAPAAQDVGAAAEALLSRIDPLSDEPTLRVLTQLLHRRRRHADELDPRLLAPRGRVPEIDLPAAAAAHVEAAEAAARAIAERPEEAWDFHLDMARIAADSMRHALLAERLPENAEAAAEHVRAEAAAHARLRARWNL